MKRKRRKTASLRHEKQYLEQGLTRILGIDEAGRGPWAGPVVAGAVCLPINNPKLNLLLKGVNDSKKLTPRQRAELVDRIKDTAVAWGIGSASNVEIDDLGIVPATFVAMERALLAVDVQSPGFEPDCLFLDSMLWIARRQTPQVSIVEGDGRSLSIAAASVLAKVWRDEHMLELDAAYPQYGFAQHKGYGTVQHQNALELHGASPVHRQSFKPVHNVVKQTVERENL